jgi:hypothetical protein
MSIDRQDAGPIGPPIPALSVFPAGLRPGWRLCAFGLLLPVARRFAAEPKTFIWILLLVAAVAICGAMGGRQVPQISSVPLSPAFGDASAA